MKACIFFLVKREEEYSIVYGMVGGSSNSVVRKNSDIKNSCFDNNICFDYSVLIIIFMLIIIYQNERFSLIKAV